MGGVVCKLYADSLMVGCWNAGVHRGLIIRWGGEKDGERGGISMDMDGVNRVNRDILGIH